MLSLYTFSPTSSDKSHGLNVARLAQIAEDILEEAHLMSEEFEVVLEMKKILAAGQPFNETTLAKVKDLWQRAKSLQK